MARKGSMTERQRDLMTLYCLHMGIRSPQNIKNHIRQYEEVREIVMLCDIELGEEDDRE